MGFVGFQHMLLTGFASLAALAAVTSAALAQTPDGDWATYNRTLRGDRYSPLKEISAANVRQLRPVATFDIGEPLNIQTGPVVIDGTMHRTQRYTRFAPGSQGGVEWNGPAYYAPRNLIVVPAIDWPVSVKRVPDAKRPKGVRGKPWTGAHDGMFGATDPKSQWGGCIVSYAVGGRQYVAEVEGIYEGIWKTKPTTGRIVIYRLP